MNKVSVVFFKICLAIMFVFPINSCTNDVDQFNSMFHEGKDPFGVVSDDNDTDKYDKNGETKSLLVPKFIFKISISNVGDIMCSGISGLETEYGSFDFRAGDSVISIDCKKTGLIRSGDMNLSNVVLINNEETVWGWINNVKQGIVQRETVVVYLLDEEGNPITTWEGKNV